MDGNGSILGNNTFDHLEFAAGKTYTLTYNRTQTINTGFVATGSCTEPITIQSSTSGSQTSISKSSGTVSISYCTLKDNNATGGATFIANNTIDLGNNTGWAITPPAPLNLYWVGGTGDWNDANNWAVTSGGAGGTCVPSSIDNVYFDANSFSGAGETVTIIGDGNNNASCKNMDWTGATNNPALAGVGTYNLRIYGSLTFISNMTFDFLGKVYFDAVNLGNTITSAGILLDNNYIYFNGDGGGWTLQDELNVGSQRIYLNYGTLNTNGQPLFADRFYSVNSNVRTLILGSSVLTLYENSVSALYFTGTNLTLDAGTSLLKYISVNGGMRCTGTGTLAFNNVICEATTGTSSIRNENGSFNTIVFYSAGDLQDGNMVDSISFAGNGRIYDDNNNINYLEFNANATIDGDGTYGEVYMGGDGTITNDNTFGTLEFTAGNAYTLTYNKTQIIQNDLIANGTSTELIIIQTNSAGNQTTFSKSSGAVTVEYVSLQDNNATGGASFTANNSFDMGNNTGWTINSPGGTDYYWVGGTGDYDDASHWATTSGGTGGAGVPNFIDNVFFDANSFSAPGQIVTAIGDASHNVNCTDMDWTGATNNPVLAGAATEFLKIYGSLTFISNMSFDFLGKVYFEATDAGHTVTCAELLMDSDNIYFNGDGGEWTLQDELNVGSQRIYLNYGTLNTNGQPVFADRFYSSNTNTRTLILGSSVLTLAENSGVAFYVNGTNLTLDAGTSVIKLPTASGGMSCTGTGTLAFNNVLCEAITGNSYIKNQAGSFNTIVYNSHGYLEDGNTVDSVTFAGNGIIKDDNNNINYLEFNVNGTINNNGTYGEVLMGGDGTITGNNTFGTLEFTAGNAYTLTYNRTQIIQDDLIANGTSTDLIIIQSSVAGNQSTFSKSGGAVTVEYVSLQDNNATGGAIFTANNSIDLGNNTGWIINAAGGTDYYWVGGTGDYNDASHWASTSGGAGGAGVPNINDNVFFDANSFTAPGQIVTAIGDASHNVNCKDMDWTGATNDPVVAGAATEFLKIYGSLTFIPNMSFDFSGKVYFEATDPGHTVICAGLLMDNDYIYFNGDGGEWTLQDELNVGDEIIYLNYGTLSTNGQPVFADRFYSNNTNTRTLILGSSVLTLAENTTYAFLFNGTNLTLDAGTSLIKFPTAGGGMNCTGSGNLGFYDVICEALTGNSQIANQNGSFNTIVYNNNGTLQDGNTVDSVTFTGNGIIYDNNNNINYLEFNANATINGNNGIYGEVFMGGDGNIVGNNTFGTLEFTAGNVYTLTRLKTQTIQNDFIANGSCSAPITIQSDIPGNQTTISKSSGTITINRVSLQDNNATGGATFIANNTLDLGNNTGWAINPVSSEDLYWVGGTGNWSDVSHWAASTGGPGGYCLPTQIDNVIFDANSFTQTGQAVYVDIADAECQDMDWSGVSYNPTFTANSNTYNLHVFGSLTLDPAMNYSFQGKVYFEGGAKSKATYNITMNGHNLNNDVYFNGIGGEWVLQDEFNAGNNNIYLNNGSLNTNGQTVSCNIFNSNNSNTRVLILGSSIINCAASGAIAWNINGTNLTLNAGTSEIRIASSNGDFRSENNPVLQYDDVLFQSTGGTSTLNSNAEFNTVTFMGNGEVKGSGTFNNVTFNFDGLINENNTFGTALFNGNGVINGTNVFDILEFSYDKTYTLQAGYIQTITTDLIANGTCYLPVVIQSSNPGTQATFSKLSGSVVVDYVTLQDNNAIGGASFTANNTLDLGNNSGWTINAPAPLDLYWVNGTGDWSDISHWASSSGGTGGYCLPSADDDVFFDANSFDGPGQLVYLDLADLECKDMDWTDVTDNPTFTAYSPTYHLHVFGSLTLDPYMVFDIQGEIYFDGTTTGNTITTAGHQFNSHINFNGAGGEWTLQDELDVASNAIVLKFGVLNTNSQVVNARKFLSFYNNTRGVVLGSSVITLTDDFDFGWDVNGTNFTLNAGTSEIILNSLFAGFRSIVGNYLNYNKITFPTPGGMSMLYTDDEVAVATFYNEADIREGGVFGEVNLYENGSIRDGNEFNNLNLSPGKNYEFESGQTQLIINQLNITGGSCTPIYLYSDTPGSQATISKSSGTVTGDYVFVKDMNATGGATFNLNNSFDLGNNTGWNFATQPGDNFNLTAFLEGPFNVTDMNTDLNPYITFDHPFNGPPWNYSTCQTVPVIPNGNIVDWVLVELRDAQTPVQATGATTIARQAAFLLDDGSIVQVDGSSQLKIDVSPTYNLYAVIWHRNHLAIMSANALVESGGTYTYDFSSSSSQVYGGTAGCKLLGGAIWGMFCGDGNADGYVNINDKINIWESEAGNSGYWAGDFNLNGQVSNQDKNDYWLPNDGEGSKVP